MGRFWSGWKIRVQDASVAGLMNALNEAGVSLWNVQSVDAITVRFDIAHGDAASFRAIAHRRGSHVEYCRPVGTRPVVCRTLRRRIFVAGLLLGCALLAVSNLFVWRIEVSGNETVPVGAVVRAMERAGVGSGCFWPSIDGVQLKHRMLLELDQLQWLGLNYRSGVLKVSVREREVKPEVIDNDAPNHIAAARDAVITEITAKQGQSMVCVGDAVGKGEVLISGAVKSTLGDVRGVYALGAVKGHTRRVMTAKVLSEEVLKQYTGRKTMKFALIFGKNRINFSLGSSISPATCDKITMDYHLCMEDVLTLPLCLVVERYEYWEPVVRTVDEAERLRYGKATLMDALEQRLVPRGEVVSAEFAAAECRGGSTVTLAAECLEEIGEKIPVSEEELQGENTLGEDTTND